MNTTNASGVTIGVLLFVVAAGMRMAGKAPKSRAILFFGSGATLGIGLLSNIMVKLTQLLEHATDITTAKLFGAGVPIALVIGLGVFLYFQVHPKNGSPHGWTDFLAFLLPAILTGAGGQWALLGAHATAGTTSLGNTLLSFIQDLASGL